MRAEQVFLARRAQEVERRNEQAQLARRRTTSGS
jgi:hypothetical protein